VNLHDAKINEDQKHATIQEIWNVRMILKSYWFYVTFTPPRVFSDRQLWSDSGRLGL